MPMAQNAGSEADLVLNRARELIQQAARLLPKHSAELNSAAARLARVQADIASRHAFAGRTGAL